MCNKLMPQDEFDRRMDFQHQKFEALKIIRQMAQDDYNEGGIKWHKGAPPLEENARVNVISQEGVRPCLTKSCLSKGKGTAQQQQIQNCPIKVMSKNNLCTAKSCLKPQKSQAPKQCRFGENPKVVVKSIPKYNEQYLYTDDEDEEPPTQRAKQGGKQCRFNAQPKVSHIPNDDSEYLIAGAEYDGRAYSRPVRKEEIMSQAVFQRKIDFQQQKILAKKQMDELYEEDAKECQWKTLKPDYPNTRINVISKDNPCKARSCMKGTKPAEAKQCQFGVEPKVSVAQIPKGDQYLFSDDEESDDDYSQSDSGSGSDTDSESMTSSDDGSSQNCAYQSPYNYEPKMAPAMVQDDQCYDEPETFVNTHLHVGHLKRNNQCARGGPNARRNG